MPPRTLPMVALIAVALATCGAGAESTSTASSTTASSTTATSTSSRSSTSSAALPEATLAAGGASTTGLPAVGGGPTAGPTPTTARAASASGPCAVPARRPADANRPRYELSLDVRLDENVVVGSQSVRFTPDRDTDRLVFRLWPNGPRLARAGARLDIGASKLDGGNVPASVTDPTTLVLRPEGGIDAGKTVEATVAWRLRLPGANNDRISRSGDSVRLGSFFPILSWEPGVGWAGEPPTTAFAEASTAPTADFGFTVRGLPPGVVALASGVYDGPGHWTATAVRDIALSLGRFRIVGGRVNAPHPVDITVGVAAGLRDDPGAYLAKARRVFADFSARFGPYEWSSYTLAITPGLNGGIEYPGHVMQGPGTIGRTTSHEIGHMWFFGLVGNNQGRDPWLDEGFATYAEGRFEGTLASMRSRTIPSDAKGRLGAPMTYWEGHQGSYYRGVYVQGAQAIAALGPLDRVDCALRAYAASAANTVATNRSFIDAVRPTFPDAEATLGRYGVRP